MRPSSLPVLHPLTPDPATRARPAAPATRGGGPGTAVVLALALALVAPAGAVDLQGHRGARGLAPENTLAAFDAAMRVGVTTLELDTVMTADDVVIVHHDRRLHPDHTRDTAGAWLAAPGPVLRQLRASDLVALDVGRARPGSRTAAAFPDQRPADGERVPTLDAVFARARAVGPSGLRFNIETKLSPLAPDESPPPEVFARALLAVVQAHGLAERVTVQSFDWRTLRAVKRLAPQIRTACLTSQQPGGPPLADGSWTDGLRLADHGGSVPRLVRAAGCDVWSPSFPDLTPAGVAEARALGLTISAWTVNAPADMAHLLDLGVDGLITDRPDLARAVMATRGLPLPPAVDVPGRRP